MGPRKFVAGRLADFLLDHGHLEERVVRRIGLDHCLELQQDPTTITSSAPWWNFVLAHAENSDDPQHDIITTQYRSAMLLLVSFLVTYDLEKRRDWNRKQRLYYSSSHQQPSSSASRLWKYASDALPLYMARASLCLAALRTILETHGSLTSSSLIGEKLTLALRERVYFMGGIVGLLEGIPLFTLRDLHSISLWSILVSAILSLLSLIWSILDPRRIGDSTTSARISWHNCSATVMNAATTVMVNVVVLWLAYIDLPLFRTLINSEMRNEIGCLGLVMPPGLVKVLKQTLSSFVGFCIFHKALPRDANASTESKEANPVGKSRKHVCDPVLVRRMSALAQEARERVQARKMNGSRQLHRCYSEGNFATISSPSSPRRRSLRSKYDGIKYPPPPRSPLMDIHLAGPTLSSKALFAKLKDNESIMLKRSVSTGCLVTPVPDSILITVPSLPNLAEEEKVLEEEDEGSEASTQITHPSEEESTWDDTP